MNASSLFDSAGGLSGLLAWAPEPTWLLVLCWLIGGTGVVLTAVGTIELLLLTFGSWVPARRRQTSGEKIWLTVVVPAHDEEAGIATTIDSLQAAMRRSEGAADSSVGSAELVVIADNCTDDTATIARQAGARVLERTNPDERGKGFALDWAFTQLLGEDCAERAHLQRAFLVIDADSRVEEGLVEAVGMTFRSGAGALQARYLVDNADDSPRTRVMHLALLAFNSLRPRGRHRLGLSAGILGNGFGLTAEALQRVPYEATSVVEDLEYHPRLIAAGVRVHFVEDTTVYAVMPSGEAAATTQRARWEGGRLRMLLDLGPQLLGQILRGRWRQFEPLFDLLLLPLAYHCMLLPLGLLAPSAPLRLFTLVGFGAVGLHVASAAVQGGRTADLLVAVRVPFYLLWKLRNLGRIVGSARTDQEWVRTEREGADSAANSEGAHDHEPTAARDLPRASGGGPAS